MSTPPTEPTQEAGDGLLGRLARYVSAAPDDEHVAACLAEASGLVAAELGAEEVDGVEVTANTFLPVPAAVRDRAVLEVAADLFYRRQTRLGVTGFADSDLNPLRVTRDPLAGARPILAPYMAGGFA